MGYILLYSDYLLLGNIESYGLISAIKQTPFQRVFSDKLVVYRSDLVIKHSVSPPINLLTSALLNNQCDCLSLLTINY